MPLLSGAWDGRAAPRLTIVGTTAWNGLGASAYQTWAFRRAELTAFAETPFRGPSGARLTMAHIRSMPPRTPCADRMGAIVNRLLTELLTPVARDLGGARIGLSLGLPERMSTDVRDKRQQKQKRDVEAEAKRAIERLGMEAVVEGIPRGNAAFAFGALQVGHALASGALEVAVLGGVDSYYDPGVLESLGEQERLFEGENLDGFIPGEGGALMLVARHDVARRMRWPALGHLTGAAVNDEIGHSFSDIPCMGLGLSRAAIAATEPLRATKSALDWWMSDMTPETYRVHEFQLAWPRAASDIMSPQSTLEHLPTYLGDLGAATMPTGVAIALEGMKRRAPIASAALVTGTSWGVDRGAVLVTG